MTTGAEPMPPRPVSQLALWFGFLGGAIAWTAHLLLSYPLVYPVCETGLQIILHGVSLATLAVAAAAGFVAWRSWQRTREPPDTNSERALVLRTSRFMALGGILLNVLFFLIILAEWLPVFFQDPCIRV